MEQVLFFILGIGIGAFLVWILESKKMRNLEKELERTQKEIAMEREVLGGFEEYNKKIAQIKEERKQKILEALRRKDGMQTNQAADLLDVSRATAFRYLEELEKEGKIKQVGAFGKEVKYKAV